MNEFRAIEARSRRKRMVELVEDKIRDQSPMWLSGARAGRWTSTCLSVCASVLSLRLVLARRSTFVRPFVPSPLVYPRPFTSSPPPSAHKSARLGAQPHSNISSPCTLKISTWPSSSLARNRISPLLPEPHFCTSWVRVYNVLYDLISRSLHQESRPRA